MLPGKLLSFRVETVGAVIAAVGLLMAVRVRFATRRSTVGGPTVAR